MDSSYYLLKVLNGRAASCRHNTLPVFWHGCKPNGTVKLLRTVSTGTELEDVINETQSAELNMKNEIKHILRARVGADVEIQPVIPGMCPVSV